MYLSLLLNEKKLDRRNENWINSDSFKVSKAWEKYQDLLNPYFYWVRRPSHSNKKGIHDTSLNLIILGCFNDLWFIISLWTCSSICKNKQDLKSLLPSNKRKHQVEQKLKNGGWRKGLIWSARCRETRPYRVSIKDSMSKMSGWREGSCVRTITVLQAV